MENLSKTAVLDSTDPVDPSVEASLRHGRKGRQRLEEGLLVRNVSLDLVAATLAELVEVGGLRLGAG